MRRRSRRAPATVMATALCVSVGTGTAMYAAGLLSVRAAGTVTFWMQTMDSCQTAIPGATFVLSGNGVNQSRGPGQGTRPITVTQTHGGCPLERGNCQAIGVGCVSWQLPIPASGSVTYTVTQPSRPQTPPPGFANCTGGSACRGQSTSLTVNSAGQISATTTNIDPDGFVVTWPAGGTYTGSITDPAVVHDFGIGNGSCDGDNDADDHSTGTPGPHCDSEGDPPPPGFVPAPNTLFIDWSTPRPTPTPPPTYRPYDFTSTPAPLLCQAPCPEAKVQLQSPGSGGTYSQDNPNPTVAVDPDSTSASAKIVGGSLIVLVVLAIAAYAWYGVRGRRLPKPLAERADGGETAVEPDPAEEPGEAPADGNASEEPPPPKG